MSKDKLQTTLITYRFFEPDVQGPVQQTWSAQDHKFLEHSVFHKPPNTAVQSRLGSLKPIILHHPFSSHGSLASSNNMAQTTKHCLDITLQKHPLLQHAMVQPLHAFRCYLVDQNLYVQNSYVLSHRSRSQAIVDPYQVLCQEEWLILSRQSRTDLFGVEWLVGICLVTRQCSLGQQPLVVQAEIRTACSLFSSLLYLSW